MYRCGRSTWPVHFKFIVVLEPLPPPSWGIPQFDTFYAGSRAGKVLGLFLHLPIFESFLQVVVELSLFLFFCYQQKSISLFCTLYVLFSTSACLNTCDEQRESN